MEVRSVESARAQRAEQIFGRKGSGHGRARPRHRRGAGRQRVQICRINRQSACFQYFAFAAGECRRRFLQHDRVDGRACRRRWTRPVVARSAVTPKLTSRKPRLKPAALILRRSCATRASKDAPGGVEASNAPSDFSIWRALELSFEAASRRLRTRSVRLARLLPEWPPTKLGSCGRPEMAPQAFEIMGFATKLAAAATGAGCVERGGRSLAELPKNAAKRLKRLGAATGFADRAGPRPLARGRAYCAVNSARTMRAPSTIAFILP